MGLTARASAWPTRSVTSKTRPPITTGAWSPLTNLIRFCTNAGDAWLLDITDQLAARLAWDGDPEPIHLAETDTSFAIEWNGHYRIDGPAFVNADRDTGRGTTILGYPTKKMRKRADLKISNMFG
jgi:hypothetical protein